MTIDETIADLRALLGDPEVVSVDIDVAHALADEVERLRAIVEGRTTPPTDEEIASHHATRGRWYVADHAGGGEVRGYPPTVREIAGWHRERAATWRWCALDSHGRPCAWPGGGQ